MALTLARLPDRQRVAGIRPADHHYAPTGEAVPAGTLMGVTVRVSRVPGGEVKIGPARVDLDAGVVTAWQIANPAGGWIEGPSWSTPEAAVAVARDPARLATLVLYAQVRDDAWDAHVRSRSLDRQAAELLAAIEGEQ